MPSSTTSTCEDIKEKMLWAPLAQALGWHLLRALRTCSAAGRWDCTENTTSKSSTTTRLGLPTTRPGCSHSRVSINAAPAGPGNAVSLSLSNEK